MGLDIKKLMRDNHQVALRKGFWDDESVYQECHIYNHEIFVDQTAQKLAMVHAEISEALEEARKSSDYTKIYFKGKKPEGFGVELGDAVLRILDLAQRRGVDLERCIRLKVRYNKTRPKKHGKRY